jgi:protein-S-isoprenylcysteine O-methyltransferase Ste14
LIDTIWNGLMWVWFASEVLILVITRTRRGGGKVQDRGSMLLVWITIFASITASQWIRAIVPAAHLHGADWLKPLSLGLFLAGLAIRHIAIFTLGKAFSVNVAIRPEQTVQRTGIYRFVRHPSYLGMLVIFLAVGLETRNWASLLAVLIPTTCALLYRIHVEEAALLNHFGPDYATYADETKRLIPGVY